MLKIQQLSKNFGQKTVLNKISFSINKGQIVGVVGENGAGKSTLLSILATLQQPTTGTISLNEHKYADHLKNVRKQIGFVPQDIAIWDELTVEENMVFFEKLRSEERRVGKECRSRGWREHEKKEQESRRERMNKE